MFPPFIVYWRLNHSYLNFNTPHPTTKSNTGSNLALCQAKTGTADDMKFEILLNL